VPLVFFGVVMVRSLLLVRILHRVTWRGRQVRVGGKQGG
jgi:hypothetical protein